MKKLLVRLLILAIFAAVVAGGFYLVQQLPDGDEQEITLAKVERGDLEVKTHFRGELQAVRSLTITAPNLGSQSQILQLAPAGALARRGDLLFELDDSERVAALEDDRLAVEKIQQELKKAETELEIRKSQDEVALVRANFQVRRWELENRRNELASAIDARKNELSLEEAKRRKAKLEEDIQNRLAQREAELAVLREQLKKAELDVRREENRIAQARVLAPISGLVQILENRSGGRGGFGTTTPTIREGDQIPPGMAVAQLLDLSEMELTAKVEEVERANLREGQEALIRLDALPGKVVKGTIKRLGNTASMNIFRGEATKKFDCVLAIDMKQLLENVGAGPEQVRRILATAEQNAAAGFGASRGGGGRGAGGGRGSGGSGPPAGFAAGGRPQPDSSGGPQARGGGQGGPGQQRGGQAGAGGGGRRGGGGANFLSRLPQEAQDKIKELANGKEFSDLSQEERRNIMQQIRPMLQQAGGGRGGAGSRQAGRGAGGPGGAGAARGGAPAAAASAPPVNTGGGGEFTDARKRNAKLPSPPEEGSDVDILLRPGLLADAEVIVESMTDVLYVPYQAVFESPKGPIVYAWNGAELEARPVELGQRSESQIVIASGLDEGEEISLQPPASEREAQRKASQKKKNSSPGGFGGGGFGGAPGGSRGGAGGGGRGGRR